MRVVAGVLFFIIMLVSGLFGIGAGIVGIVLSNFARKKGKKFGKPLIIVCSIILAINVVVTAVPVTFFTQMFIANTQPPENFVETAIVIEEDGYQDESFTADGVVYEVIDEFYVGGDDYLSNPIFSYKTSGFMNGSQCGNYYKVENEKGFNLVTDDIGLLFCPIDEKEEVIKIYGNNDHYEWWICDDDYTPSKKVGDEEQKIADKLYDIYLSNAPIVTVVIDWEVNEEYWFDFVSIDNLFTKDSLQIWKIDSKYYIQTSDLYGEEVEWDGSKIKIEAIEIENVDVEKLIASIK